MERRGLGATPPTAAFGGNIVQFPAVMGQNKRLLVWVVERTWDKDFKTVRDLLFLIVNVLNLLSITLSLLLMQFFCLACYKTWQILDFQWLRQCSDGCTSAADPTEESQDEKGLFFYSLFFSPKVGTVIFSNLTEKWKKGLKRWKSAYKRKSHFWKVATKERTGSSKVIKISPETSIHLSTKINKKVLVQSKG